METVSVFNPSVSIKTLTLAAIIPCGRENAIKRKTLANAMGMSDREARKAIHDARVDGLPILNDSDGRGYWLSDDNAEIERFVRQETARAKKIFHAVSKMRKRVKEA